MTITKFVDARLNIIHKTYSLETNDISMININDTITINNTLMHVKNKHINFDEDAVYIHVWID